MITQKEDIAIMGRGGYGMGFEGNQTWLWWILIVLFIFIFMFRGRDGEHKHGHGYGYGGDCGHVKGQRPVFYDESNYQQDRHICKEVTDQAEKTRSLIELNYREQANRDFYKSEIEKTALLGKINTLEMEKNFDRKFCELTAVVQRDYGLLQGHLGKIDCEIKALPKSAPCYIPTRTIPTCEPCTIPSRHDFGGGGCGC